MPIALEFSPDIIIVSAGFDAAYGDPIGQCSVTPAGYATMTHLLRSIAAGKLLLVLEGGYNISVISDSSSACMSVLLGNDPPVIKNTIPRQATYQVVEKVTQIHSNYWNCLVPKYTRIPIEKPATFIGLSDVMKEYWEFKMERGLRLANVNCHEDSKGLCGSIHMSDSIYSCQDVALVLNSSVESRYFFLLTL